MLKVIVLRGCYSIRTVHILDHDGREIAFHPEDIPSIIKSLKRAQKDPGIPRGQYQSTDTHQKAL